MKKRYITKLVGFMVACMMLMCVLPAMAEQTDEAAASVHPAYDWVVLENATTVRIGRDGQTDFAVDMYDHAATRTMLDYLPSNALLFPTYTYEEEAGFVAQNIRGNYSRDDEVTITDIHLGELYLFSGNQLRLYFKDVPGANINATPVGYIANAETLTEAVQTAYTSNLGDTWGVDVYFWITRNVQ